jgi:hypothetical protein
MYALLVCELVTLELLLFWIFCTCRKKWYVQFVKFILRVAFSFIFVQCFTAASFQHSVISVATIGTIKCGGYQFSHKQNVCNICQNLLVMLVITLSHSIFSSIAQMTHCNFSLSLSFLHFIQHCLSFSWWLLLTLVIAQSINDWMIVNRKLKMCGGHWSWPNLKYYLTRFLQKLQKTLIRIVIVPAKIWIRHLPNISQEYYHFNQLPQF